MRSAADAADELKAKDYFSELASGVIVVILLPFQLNGDIIIRVYPLHLKPATFNLAIFKMAPI